MPNYKGMTIVNGYIYCWDADHKRYLRSKFPADFIDEPTISNEIAELIANRTVEEHSERSIACDSL